MRVAAWDGRRPPPPPLAPSPPPAVATLALNVDVYEVLLGPAEGFEVRVVPWMAGAPPPPGSVVVGVSAKGDPLLAALASHSDPSSGAALMSVGYASAREALVTVAQGGRVLTGPW